MQIQVSCWGGYEWRRNKVIQAQPNRTHIAIAELDKHVPRLSVVTQNVDDLHERAGSQEVIHLHGSLHSPRCVDCGLAYTLPLMSDALPEDGSRIEPPRCSGCSGDIRPGIVWFGEMLPEDAWSASLAAAEECDVFLSIGTSGGCLPSCGIPATCSRPWGDCHSHQSYAFRYQQSGALSPRPCFGDDAEPASRGMQTQVTATILEEGLPDR